MDTKFDGTDEFFDSRDVVARIEELKDEFTTNTGDDPDGCQMSDEDWQAGLSEDDATELVALLSLQEEADGTIADWNYGETFYEKEYFRENYAEEFCKDVGYFPQDTPSWITDHIDWEAVADELLEDYTEFEFRGVTYVAR